MSDYQCRAIAEKDQLDERIEKLEAFFVTITHIAMSEKEKTMLRRQYLAMIEYSSILGERIKLFPA